MKIQVIKSFRLDNFGNKYTHTTINRIGKKKQIAKEIVSVGRNPLYKRVTDGKIVTEFDMGLFGKWIKRK